MTTAVETCIVLCRCLFSSIRNYCTTNTTEAVCTTTTPAKFVEVAVTVIGNVSAA
jgi:hypothetical protein